MHLPFGSRPNWLKFRCGIADLPTYPSDLAELFHRPAIPEASAMTFDAVDALQSLDAATDEALDLMTFGVIGMDPDGQVQRYNSWESKAAGLSPAKVLSHHLFTVVAPCMNNFMVAQRFEDANKDGSTLDATIDYVLTLRMRPIKVKLRLLAKPRGARRYVLVQRPT